MNQSFDREAMLDLVGAYALGVLPPSEHALVTAFILSDAEAQAEFDALRPAADAVGFAAEQPIDRARSDRMRAKLMATVRADVASPKVTPIGAARRSAPENRAGLIGTGLAAAAAIAFALVSTIQNFSLRSDLALAKRSASQLQTAATANEQTHVREAQRDRETIADLVASDAQRFTVPEGDVVKRGDRIYFALRTLPVLPKGKVYQAWTLAKGAKTVAPSVTFVPSADGVAVIELPANASTLAAVALTIEPEGGSKTPTSKPTFIRPLS